MKTFSSFFGLEKTQSELDFVDVPINADIPLFVDPFAISQRPDRWSQQAHLTLITFFQRIVDAIKSGRGHQALEMLQFLKEPNETRLGYSKGKPQGAGIGPGQADELYQALRDSSAVKTGFINSLEECELMIDGISRDKISDLTTNILRAPLAEYTLDQCVLHGIPTQDVALPLRYSPDTHSWVSGYLPLPVIRAKPALLVPKAIARYDLAYDHQHYYNHFVVSFLQAEALSASSSLVRTLKNGKRVVYKKDIKQVFPVSKDFLYSFSRDHPQVLAGYREELTVLERAGANDPLTEEDEAAIAGLLGAALQATPAGSENASTYHSLMIGIVEFVFYPSLLYPKKEREIHQGRKRIDIVMENGARSGIFARLHEVRKLPSAFVAFECKNYTTEVANPELDQLAGRFSLNRGKVGFLCCRTFDVRATFIERCRDTLRDDRGLILPLDDTSVLTLLKAIHAGHRSTLDAHLTRLVDEVWLS
jgi:hypothetical protein